MSLHDLQSAIAYVIRSFDHENIKNIDELCERFAITSDEKVILENLIHQQRLRAYSEELFLARWTIISESLIFLRPYIDFSLLRELWEKSFEPQSTEVIHENLALRFVQYLVLDPAGANFISNNAPPYGPALMRYIYAVFTFRHNVLPKLTITEESSLTGRYFEVIDLNYDVREFFADLVVNRNNEDSTRVTPPPERDITMLFIALDEITEFRSFEIDQELATYLKNQLTGKSSPPPPCYDDLVELGLLKPKNMRHSCCNHIH